MYLLIPSHLTIYNPTIPLIFFISIFLKAPRRLSHVSKDGMTAAMAVHHRWDSPRSGHALRAVEHGRLI